MRTLRRIEKLAVDANPLLSAIIGGSARAVFLAAEHVSFYATRFNFRKVERYIPALAAKRKIPLEDLYLSLSMLPLAVCDEDFYKPKFRQAVKLVGKRDPDDAHLLALALRLDCPVWSNDRDFEGLGIRVHTTLDLIK